jgi:hypothetical protein
VPLYTYDMAASPLAGEALATFRSRLLASDRPLIFLAVVEAYKPADLEVAEEIPLGCEAQGCQAAGQEGYANAELLYFSDREFATGPAESPANQPFEPRLIQALRLDRSIPLTPLDGARVAGAAGALELYNADGGLDGYAERHPVDGRRVRVLAGLRGTAYADFTPLFDGRAVAWSSGRRRAALELRGNEYLLDRPVQENRYAGTGGAEGADENAGKTKPLLIGTGFNLSPEPIDRANVVFQFHDPGPGYAAQSVTAVRDRGAALTASGSDYASYAALVAAAAPSAGQYHTALAAGMIRLASIAANSVVTVDAVGEALQPSGTPDVWTAGGGYAGGAVAALRDRVGLDVAVFDLGTFYDLDVARPWKIGLYLGAGDESSFAEVVDRLLGSVGAHWGDLDGTGRISAGFLAAPEGASQALAFAAEELEPLEMLQPPGAAFPPWWRCAVGYKPNFTPQSGEDLASGVSSADKQRFAQAQLATDAAEDAQVLQRHLAAQDVGTVPSFLVAEADAVALRDLLFALHKAARAVYEGTDRRSAWGLMPGMAVGATYPRFGLDFGATARVVALGFDAEARTVKPMLWR